jgi:FKBP-type peptidyl-prolyl cis-trans isomerase
VIKGFAEGLKLMRLGGKYRVIIPSELAYGERGINGVVPGNAALDFTVTLDAIQPKDSSTAN